MRSKPARPDPTPPRARQPHDYTGLVARWKSLAHAAGLRLHRVARHDDQIVLAVRSPALGPRGGIYLSAGIHGDEPAGPRALIEWAESNAHRLARLPLFCLPCLNPWGLIHNRREDASNHDLNRRWQSSRHPLIGAIHKLIGAHHFAIALCLHEDYDAEGLYLYEPRGDRPPIGKTLLDSGSPIIPPDHRTVIDGHRVARTGLVSRRVTRAMFHRIGLPEAVWLHLKKADASITVETPSEHDFERRVACQITLIEAAINLHDATWDPAHPAARRPAR